MKTKLLLLVAVGVLGATMQMAKADEWNQKTVVKFSESVEIPGQVLPAGTYVFKLVNSTSNRHIVQVFNKDENQVFGTFLATSTVRSNHPMEKFPLLHSI